MPSEFFIMKPARPTGPAAFMPANRASEVNGGAAVLVSSDLFAFWAISDFAVVEGYEARLPTAEYNIQ